MAGAMSSKKQCKQSDMEGAGWAGLPEEIVAEIFSKLPHKDRYSIVPLVSHEWKRIHLEHPPCPKELRLEKTISASMLDWILSVADALEEVDMEIQEVPGLVSQALALLHYAAPNLKRVYLDGVSGCSDKSLLRSVSLFRNIVLLDFMFDFPSDGDVAVIRGLSGLQSLQDLNFGLAAETANAQQAEAFWGALGALKKLTFLEVLIYEPPDDQKYDAHAFFAHVSKLTQLRHLKINAMDTCLSEYGRAPWGFSSLLELRTLELDSEAISMEGLRPIFGLPRLHHLTLQLDLAPRWGNAHDRISLESTALTHLKLKCEQTSSGSPQLPGPADRLLDPSMPSLRRLQVLNLQDANLDGFPDSLAVALKSLTRLDLSCNKFLLVPPGLASITTLEWFSLALNPSLQLAPTDLDVFSSLTGLKSLDLWKSTNPDSDAGLSHRSVGVLMTLKERLPHVQIGWQVSGQ